MGGASKSTQQQITVGATDQGVATYSGTAIGAGSTVLGAGAQINIEDLTPEVVQNALGVSRDIAEELIKWAREQGVTSVQLGTEAQKTARELGVEAQKTAREFGAQAQQTATQLGLGALTTATELHGQAVDLTRQLGLETLATGKELSEKAIQMLPQLMEQYTASVTTLGEGVQRIASGLTGTVGQIVAQQAAAQQTGGATQFKDVLWLGLGGAIIILALLTWRRT
jgi:hypothetical protein